MKFNIMHARLELLYVKYHFTYLTEIINDNIRDKNCNTYTQIVSEDYSTTFKKLLCIGTYYHR